MPSIGDRLREERERLRLSQQAMAEACAVTMRSQRNYETGDRSPDVAYMAAAASIGVDVTYVVTGETQAARAARFVTESDEKNLREIQAARDAGVIPPAANQPDLVVRGPDGRITVLQLKDPDELKLVNQYRLAPDAGKRAILATAEAVTPPEAKPPSRRSKGK